MDILRAYAASSSPQGGLYLTYNKGENLSFKDPQSRTRGIILPPLPLSPTVFLPQMAIKKSVSLSDVALVAGVSKATVSLALRKSPKLSPETCARVGRTARELGYRRNARLSRILSETVKSRYRKTDEVIVCLITRHKRASWNGGNPAFAAMVERSLEYGYKMEPFWLFEEGVSPERANKILWARGIAGLVILPPPYSMRKDGRLTLPIDWSRFCAVEIDDVLTEPTLNRVRHNHLSGIWTALEEMEKLGYRRIGLSLVEDVEFATHHRWTAGYLYWCRVRGFDGKLDPLIRPDLGTAEIRSWIKKNRLDAVLSPCTGVLASIKDAGFKVPDDIGFASLDVSDPAVAGIDQCREVQSTMAIDLLVTMIHRAAHGIPRYPTTWTFGGEWRKGNSCRQINVAPIAGIENILIVEGQDIKKPRIKPRAKTASADAKGRSSIAK